MKNKKKENENSNSAKKLRNPLDGPLNHQSVVREIFLVIFVSLSVILGVTLFFYYRVNSNYEEEIAMIRDIHHLRANLVPFGQNKGKPAKGYFEISEVFEGVNVIGKVEGLVSGSTHAVHILEYSDISQLEESKITKDFLRHFNPTNAIHSCPSNSQGEERYHSGDLGNIIADQEGVAYISITRKVSIKSLNGRIIVINSRADKCEPTQEYDEVKDIIAYGLLNAIKPNLPSPINYSSDYFMREINTANKKEFEKKNKIHKDEQENKQKDSEVIDKKYNQMKKNRNEVKENNKFIKIGQPKQKNDNKNNKFLTFNKITDADVNSPIIRGSKVNQKREDLSPTPDFTNIFPTHDQPKQNPYEHLNLNNPLNLNTDSPSINTKPMTDEKHTFSEENFEKDMQSFLNNMIKEDNQKVEDEEKFPDSDIKEIRPLKKRVDNPFVTPPPISLSQLTKQPSSSPPLKPHNHRADNFLNRNKNIKNV